MLTTFVYHIHSTLDNKTFFIYSKYIKLIMFRM